MIIHYNSDNNAICEYEYQILLKFKENVYSHNSLSVSDIDIKFMKDLEEVIKQNFTDSEFNVKELSLKLHMNRVTLYRKVQALTGKAPSDFIRCYRLKRGAELLRSNFGTILDVAVEVGFSSATYFTKCFKKQFNQLPSNLKVAE